VRWSQSEGWRERRRGRRSEAGSHAGGKNRGREIKAGKFLDFFL